MKYLPILILCFIFLCSSSENNQVPKVLFAEPEISANVYDAEGNIIGKITNSVNNNKFLTLSLYKISDNRALLAQDIYLTALFKYQAILMLSILVLGL